MFTMGLQQYTQGKVLPEPNCGANMNALLAEIIAKHATKSSMLRERATQQPVSVVPLTNCATLFVLARLQENQLCTHNSYRLFLIGLQRCYAKPC